MDERLLQIYGKRLGRLYRSDLGPLALALVAHQRGRCMAWREFSFNLAWFRLFSDDRRIDVRVRADDWAKITPYLRDGAWATQFAPVQQVGYLRPEVARDIALLPVTDRALYLRVLDDLEREFPQDYPTSPL